MKINKQIITTTLLAVALIAVLYFGIYQQYTTLAEKDETIHNEKVILEQQKQQNSDLVSLNQQYKEIQENASKLDTAFLSKDTVSILKFIEDVESLSDSISLDEKMTITPLPQSEDDPIVSSSANLSVDGSFTNIYRFLQAIEQKPFYINFTSADITKSSDTTYTLTLDGTIYWQ